MSAILKKYGKGISFSDYRKINPDFEKAMKLLEVGWFSEAEDIFEDIAKKDFKPEPPMVKTSKEKLKEIKKAVDDRLKEIRQNIEAGKKKEALVELYILRGRCKQMKVQTTLTKEIKALEKDDAIDRDLVKKAKQEEKACEIFLKAEGYFAEGNIKSAKNYFERVEGVYKETSFYEKALKRLEEIK